MFRIPPGYFTLDDRNYLRVWSTITVLESARFMKFKNASTHWVHVLVAVDDGITFDELWCIDFFESYMSHWKRLL